MLRLIGRCEALELEAKGRRTMWGSDENQGDSTWHFNYGQEAAYRTMAKHLKSEL